MRRRLILMRHGDVSYVDEAGAPVKPEDVPLTPRGLRAGGGSARRARGRRARPRRRERPAAHARDGRDRRARTRRSSSGPSWRSGAAAGSTRSRPTSSRPLFVGALRVKDEAQRFLGGESLGEALDRVHPALERLLAREWHTALAVLHGGVNRIVISYALSGDRTYFGTFEQAPACINVLDLGDDGWIVRTVNYVPYDPLHPARTTTMEHLWEQLQPFLEERA